MLANSSPPVHALQIRFISSWTKLVDHIISTFIHFVFYLQPTSDKESQKGARSWKNYSQKTTYSSTRSLPYVLQVME